MRDLQTSPEIELAGLLLGNALEVLLGWRRGRTREQDERWKKISERCGRSKSRQSLDFSRISSISGHHIRYLPRDFSTTATSEPTSRAPRKLEVRIAHQNVRLLYGSSVWNAADARPVSLTGWWPPRRVDPSL